MVVAYEKVGRSPEVEAEIEEIQAWERGLVAIANRIGPRFARTEAREQAGAYLTGLLSNVERKNGWQLAEALGDETPYGVQHLLGRARWDADLVRDDLRAYIVDELNSPEAILALDETGFLKKGDKSVGVKRQYTGTAGKIENCQIGVFLAHLSPKGRTLLDRELYLPENWTEDRERCEAAGVPDKVKFATKAQLGQRMLERAFDGGVTAGWVVGDEVYGNNEALRGWLQGRRQPYVLAVAIKDEVGVGPNTPKVKRLLRALDDSDWERVSAGLGSKGERLYDWAIVDGLECTCSGMTNKVLFRRSIQKPSEIAAYLVFGVPSGGVLAKIKFLWAGGVKSASAAVRDDQMAPR